MRLNRFWRMTCRIIGMFLVMLSLGCGYWWFYKFAPWRCTLDQHWVATHSAQEHWREVQKGIHRGMWTHDDGFVVGWYGDKSWAQWIMEHVERGDELSCMGSLSHAASAMRHITNQDAGDEASSWLDWWAKNKMKSQEEWIVDGFRQHGCEISAPPRPDQIPTLLELLGTPDSGKTRDATPGVADYIKYNAFRFLRDSSFDPVEYAIANRSVSTAVEQGLLEYSRLQREWPAASKVGVLAFTKANDVSGDVPSPVILSFQFRMVAYTLILVPPILGIPFLMWSFRKENTCPKK